MFIQTAGLVLSNAARLEQNAFLYKGVTKMTSVETEKSWGHAEAPNRKPLLRGIHHLAINTDDLRTTLDFYVRILGMPLVHGLETGTKKKHSNAGNPPFPGIPHYFLDMGGDSLLAFFEYPKGHVAQSDRNTIGAMQHCAFVCSPKRFVEMQERLRRNDVEIVYGPAVVMPPNVQAFYFFDPHGVRLEISADLDGDDDDLGVVRSASYDKESMRRELLKISDDEAWIESMLENMSDSN